MRLMSVWATAMLAANTAVITPIQVTTVRAVEIATDEVSLVTSAPTLWSVAAINGYTRATKNTPAATIVAAWMSALTGVGPSIASGSQTCNGTWPDFPIAPQKMRSPMIVDSAIPPIMTWGTSLDRATTTGEPSP